MENPLGAFHRAALAAGGTDHGAPGLRPIYHEHYFGAFALDPDGNNVEAVCHDSGASPQKSIPTEARVPSVVRLWSLPCSG